MNEVTPEDCDKFDAYVREWQTVLNLHDWRIERGSKRSKKNMAEVVFDDVDRLATYRIGQSFGAAEVSEKTLKSTALHEVLHVFLHELVTASDESKDAAEHRVIHVLEKLLMERA